MHQDHQRRLRSSVVEAEGTTDRSFREEIWRFTAERSGGSGEGVTLAGEALPDFVDTVAREAHRSTAAQIDALREEGFDDDAIFEITVVTAAAAGVTRLERALKALKKDA